MVKFNYSLDPKKYFFQPFFVFFIITTIFNAQKRFLKQFYKFYKFKTALFSHVGFPNLHIMFISSMKKSFSLFHSENKVFLHFP